jgi:hypothetical protein
MNDQKSRKSRKTPLEDGLGYMESSPGGDPFFVITDAEHWDTLRSALVKAQRECLQAMQAYTAVNHALYQVNRALVSLDELRRRYDGKDAAEE